MPQIKKRYLVDERNKPVAVVLDLKTYRKIEQLLEDHLFGKILEKAMEKEPLTLAEARRQYEDLQKLRAKKRR